MKGSEEGNELINKSICRLKRFKSLRGFVDWMIWSNTFKKFTNVCKKSIQNNAKIGKTTSENVKSFKATLRTYFKNYGVNKNFISDANMDKEDDNNEEPKGVFITQSELNYLKRGNQ